VQQPGAAAPGVQAAASAREHTGAVWHVPLMQRSEPQQPALVEHAPPELWQQWFPDPLLVQR